MIIKTYIKIHYFDCHLIDRELIMISQILEILAKSRHRGRQSSIYSAMICIEVKIQVVIGFNRFSII